MSSGDQKPLAEHGSQLATYLRQLGLVTGICLEGPGLVVGGQAVPKGAGLLQREGLLVQRLDLDHDQGSHAAVGHL